MTEHRLERTDLTAWLRDPRSDAGVHWLADDGGWAYVSYAELAERASRIAGQLAGANVDGRVVTLALGAVDEFVAGFFGALWAGATPSPLAPPSASGRLAGYVDHAAHVLRLADPAYVLADNGLHEPLTAAIGTAGLACRVSAPTDSEPALAAPAEPATVGLLQFTSGSSGRPRGVAVGSDQLLANITMIRDWLDLGRDEPTASWLPTHHDMGLVGCLLTPVVNQSPIRVLRPDQFIRDPARWLTCFGRYGATATATPTFGLAYTLDRLGRNGTGLLDGLDLSGWRVAIVGAERIDAGVLARFASTFEPYGFDAAAFRPAYGLAEATLAVTGSAGGTPRVVRPAWSAMRTGAKVELAGPVPLASERIGDGNGWAVCCGGAHPGLDVRILDDDGQPLGERRLGEIAVTGTSVTPRPALGTPTSTTRLVGEQLRTGDAGFLVDGELVVVGRIGDRLEVRGRGVYAEELEHLVQVETGAPAGRIAVLLGVLAGRETVVLVSEQPLDADVESRARAVLGRAAGGADVQVRPGPRGTILRTSSGKTRRREMWRLLTESAEART